VVAGLLAALLVACSGSPGGAGGTPAPDGGQPTALPAPTASVAAGAEPATDPRFGRFYEQSVTWEKCGQRLECAKVTVPVDWQHPDGATLQLSVVRRPATDRKHRIGSLLMNPGGPGASGVQYVADYGDHITTRALRGAFDLVGFDPRGVGESDPVDCLPDAELDRFLAFDADPQQPGGLQAMRQEARDFAAGCEAHTGALLGHVDTASAARDMDVLRAVLGDQRLSYLGKSYGTFLGAMYAEEFPQRVGRLVLDGAIDPALSSAQIGVGQAAGMEQALRAYVTDCLTRRDCPLRGSVDDALGQVRSVVDAARQHPLRTDDPNRSLTASLAFYGLIAPLYENASWPMLDQALAAALAGDGSLLLELADLYADRQPDGEYGSNLLEAFNAVNCLDYPVDASPGAMEAEARRLEQASPTFGDAMAYGELLCAAWPVPPVLKPAPLHAKGSPPILVVGTTGDPATPYDWAVSLAKQLDSGRLLTWHGEGHTAYMRGSACVDAAVDGYLVDGVLPGKDATCRT
jgi:pimeloyl-ACP methyl ester carboxylesterase